MLRKLKDLQKKGSIEGVTVTHESSFEEIEDEYNFFMNEKLKQESIKLQKQWLFNGINALEFFNNQFNPFDLDLTGWSEKIAEDCEDDDEVFGELYEKYKGGKLAPEVKLLLRVATTAVFISLTNKMISAAVPGMSDVIRQNPEIMKTFMSATVDSLNKMPEMQSNPMMSFAQEILHQEPKPSMQHGAPPAPLETKIRKGGPPPPPSGGANFQEKTPIKMPFTNRPDLTAAKQGNRIPLGMQGLRESGIEINQNFSSVRPDMSGPKPEHFTQLNPPNIVRKPSVAPPSFSEPEETLQLDIASMNEDSVFSIESLKSLQSMQSTQSTQSTQSNTRRRRKTNKSDKNLVLDI